MNKHSTYWKEALDYIVRSAEGTPLAAEVKSEVDAIRANPDGVEISYRFDGGEPNDSRRGFGSTSQRYGLPSGIVVASNTYPYAWRS